MRESETMITWREWRFVALIGLGILVMTSVPYAYAAVTLPADKRFIGFILNASDHAQYLAWYKGFQTAFLIPNTLTPETNPPVFFNLLWFALGRLGRYTGLSHAIIYQMFRWASGAFFMGMVYTVAALFFPKVHQRRTAFLITILGSGLGWIWLVLKYTLGHGKLLFPLDVYIAEGNSFLCVMAYPHFAEAAGLILAVIGLLLMGERRGQLRYAVFAGLTAHFLGWQHGYDLLIVWGVPSVYAGVRWVVDRQWPDYWFKAMLITGLLSWPPALYAVLLTRLNPIWKEVLAQFVNAGAFTPNPLHMIVAMGLPLILALLTLVLLALRLGPGRPRELSSVHNLLFIGVWFVVGWALAYTPTDYQIHMLNSWQVPIGLLATICLYCYITPRLAKWRIIQRPLVATVIVFLVLSMPTNFYLWTWRLLELNDHDYPYFLHADELAGLEWLEANTPPDAIVLSSYDVGRYVPGISGRRPFLAHWAQTVRFYDKRDRVASFYDANTDEEVRLETLETFGIDYVFFGPAERALGAYDPSESPALSVVLSTSLVTIYQVR